MLEADPTSAVCLPAANDAEPLCFSPNVETFRVHDSDFRPDFVLRLSEEPQPTSLTGGRQPASTIPVRAATTAYIGLCRSALIRWTRVRKRLPIRVDCKRSASYRPSHAWHVAAFDWIANDWQHHVINAAPTLGMVGPVLRRLMVTDANVTVLHSGLLSHNNVRIRMPPPSVSLRYAHLYEQPSIPDRSFQLPLSNFVMAFPMPENEGVLPALTASPLSEGDWYPRSSYWPLRPTPKVADTSASNVVAFLSRNQSGTRRLANEREVVGRLHLTLRELGLRLLVVNSPVPVEFFSRLAGVVGVHGGAFANVHACRPGTRIIEIMSPTKPRWCYASLSIGADLAYHAYFPRRWPEVWRYSCPAALDAKQRNQCMAASIVEVDAADFASFARHVFAAREPQMYSTGANYSLLVDMSWDARTAVQWHAQLRGGPSEALTTDVPKPSEAPTPDAPHTVRSHRVGHQQRRTAARAQGVAVQSADVTRRQPSIRAQGVAMQSVDLTKRQPSKVPSAHWNRAAVASSSLSMREVRRCRNVTSAWLAASPRHAASVPSVVVLTFMTDPPRHQWLLGLSAAALGFPLAVAGLGLRWEGSTTKLPGTLRAVELLRAAGAELILFADALDTALVAAAHGSSLRELHRLAASEQRVIFGSECNSWPTCFREAYKDDVAHQQCRTTSKTCFPNSGTYAGSSAALSRALPELRRLGQVHANDQTAVHFLYLERQRNGVDVAVDGANSIFLSLHNCEHKRHRTKDCHYGVGWEPLDGVRFENRSAAFAFQHGRGAAQQPLLVHANGDHTRLWRVWQQVASSSHMAQPSALAQHPVLAIDSAEAGLCSLTNLGRLSVT